VTTTGVEPESQIGFLGILFAIIISALVIAYALKWYLHDWREKAIEEPFEPAEDLSIWSFLRSKLPRRRVLAVIIIVVIGIPSIIFIGHMPVHRTNITHTDPEGDVSDPNSDIIRLSSNRTGNVIVIEMTVAGEIRNKTDYSPNPDSPSRASYEYGISIIAKKPNEDQIRIHYIDYDYGVLDRDYNTSAHVENDTLTIYFPMYEFISGYYMIGLEGRTKTYTVDDTTGSDRDRPVARLLF
jgi:hypothetical protein